jgi:hypothetical protein
MGNNTNFLINFDALEQSIVDIDIIFLNPNSIEI